MIVHTLVSLTPTGRGRAALLKTSLHHLQSYEVNMQDGQVLSQDLDSDLQGEEMLKIEGLTGARGDGGEG